MEDAGSPSTRQEQPEVNANKDKAKNLYDKEFVRMWEFYLASCSAAFKFRDLVVYQLQLVKNFTSPPSNCRNYIYQ